MRSIARSLWLSCHDRPPARAAIGIGRHALAGIVLSELCSSLLERAYRVLPEAARARMHRRLAKFFVGHVDRRGQATSWALRFEGRVLSMPLRARELATDWDNLLSLLGAELEVKRVYRGLLAGPPGERPEVFLDCGASYGTHSLLWGSHGVRVVAFEPNPECHATFEWITRQLAMPPTLHPLALGTRSGRNTLWYPADETWIGRVAAEGNRPARTTTGSASAWRSAAVDVVTLDAMRCAIPEGRLLVKIDVEGAELDVLRGAARLLAERRPLIVVESTPGPARAELCRFLGDLGYAVTPLVPPLAKSAAAINLLARPSA